jgi:single-strand DNA-binding protein
MLNEVRLIGRIGKVDEHTFESGKMRVMSVATWYNVQRGTEWEQVTEWHRVKEYDYKNEVNVGDVVSVSGQLKTSSYEKDGQTRYSTDIVGKGKVITRSDKSAKSSEPKETKRPDDVFIPENSDGLPF